MARHDRRTKRSPLNQDEEEATAIVPIERVERSILLVRGHKVLLDVDLADLYGVPTKALNQAVKRNRDRFPRDFMFRLTSAEKTEVVTNCDHLKKLKFSPSLPYAFTEHGAVMLATVLNSQRAVRASIFVVRAFIRLSRFLASHEELRRKLDELEQRYDHQFAAVFDAIRQLMGDDEEPDDPNRPRIGYHSEAAVGGRRRATRPRRREKQP